MTRTEATEISRAIRALKVNCQVCRVGGGSRVDLKLTGADSMRVARAVQSKRPAVSVSTFGLGVTLR